MTYFLQKRFQWLALISLAMLFNAGASTFVMLDHPEVRDRYGVVSWTLNVLTLGTFCHLAEGAYCFKTGQKTEGLAYFKVFEAVESSASLFVGVYSILIAGYLPGYPELSFATLVLRWLSVASSLVTLPKAVADFSRRFLLRGEVEGRQHYVDRVRVVSGTLALAAFQATEVWAQLTLLLFALVTRPYGVFVILAAAFLGVGGVLARYSDEKGSLGEFFLFWFLFGPLLVMFNPQTSGSPEDESGFDVALVRIATLAAAWLVIGWHWAHGFNPELEAHLQTPSPAVLAVIAAAGTVLHVGCFWQQFLAGRWHSAANQSCCFCCAGGSAQSAQE